MLRQKRVGVAWAGFMTTSIILIATSRNIMSIGGMGAAMLKGSGENAAHTLRR